MAAQPDGTQGFRPSGTECDNLYLPMDPGIKAAWMHQLRATPRTSQGRLYLRQKITGGRALYSPLGVLCELMPDLRITQYGELGGSQVFAYGLRPQISRLPDEVLVWAELESRGANVQGIYIEHNTMDARYNIKNLGDSGYNWSRLADLLEEQL